MSFPARLFTLLRAQVPLVQVRTHEEARFLGLLGELPQDLQRLGLTAWDYADDFAPLKPGAKPIPNKKCEVSVLLSHVQETMPEDHVLVLKDFHQQWASKDRVRLTRKLRNLVPRLREKGQFLIFLTPPLSERDDLPLELKDDVVVLDMPLPDRAELGSLLDDLAKRSGRPLADARIRHPLIESALGLTHSQAMRAYQIAYAEHGAFNLSGIAQVLQAKQAVIRESPAMEFWPAGGSEADIGGLDLLKKWLKDQVVGFSKEARERGCAFPKGVLLAGIPGTGKSLTAKTTASIYGLPLLRLDIGALLSSGLGESDKALRRAQAIAEAVSPCVIWMDEVEKAFGDADAPGLGGNAIARVFGSFLFWMQEIHDRRIPIYFVATANAVHQLPAPFFGRFDGAFFLDLPNDVEREAIFDIHLRRVRVASPRREFALPELVERSRGMVGREIETAVRQADMASLRDGNRKIAQADLERALADIEPIGISHKAQLDRLRQWRMGKPASSPEAAPGPGLDRQIT
jgi:hypothetical protein